jgi:hypothetical protein
MDEGFNDDSAACDEHAAHYANYCQVGHNSVEFLLQFGQQNGKNQIFTRIYTTPAHALNFSEVLSESVAQYERRFGPILRRGACGPEESD